MKLFCKLILVSCLLSFQPEPDNEKPYVSFKIGYLWSEVNGVFERIEILDKSIGNSIKDINIKLILYPKSIDLDSEMMENFVNGSDFFDSKNYPKITFQLNSIKKNKRSYEASGSLTIKGISKLIKIPVEIRENNNSLILFSKLTINRVYFNIGKHMPVLNNNVELSVKIPI